MMNGVVTLTPGLNDKSPQDAVSTLSPEEIARFAHEIEILDRRRIKIDSQSD